MGDALVDMAVGAWLPRCLQAGVNYSDWQATTARCETWDRWLAEWDRTADEAAALAQEAEAERRDFTAGEAWLRAAVTRHFGKLTWVVDPELHGVRTVQAADELRRAHARLGTGAEQIKIREDGIHVNATLRRPIAAEQPPLVLLIPGLDSSKEEYFQLERCFLDRGMATLSVDGPGQGESSLHCPLRADYEVTFAAILDALSDRHDLDLCRVGALGSTVGGILAIRAAAFDDRLRAVAGLSTPFSMGELYDSLPTVILSVLALKAHAQDDASARSVAEALDLGGICDRVDVPALLIAGGQDAGLPWQITERIAGSMPRGEFLRYAGGNHGCANLSHLVRPVIADWIAVRLAEI